MRYFLFVRFVSIRGSSFNISDDLPILSNRFHRALRALCGSWFAIRRLVDTVQKVIAGVREAGSIPARTRRCNGLLYCRRSLKGHCRLRAMGRPIRGECPEPEYRPAMTLDVCRRVCLDSSSRTVRTAPWDGRASMAGPDVGLCCSFTVCTQSAGRIRQSGRVVALSSKPLAFLCPLIRAIDGRGFFHFRPRELGL